MSRSLALAVAGLVIAAAACSGGAETLTEQILEVDDGVASVDIDDGQLTVEFEDDEGGGALSVGGGDIPEGFPLPVPEGGTVMTSLAQANSYALALAYPGDQYDAILATYATWVGDQDVESLVETKTVEPRADGWQGGIGRAVFVINLFAVPGGDEMNLVLSWEA